MAIASPEFVRTQLAGFNRLSNGQKLALMLALAAVFALVVGALIWSRTSEYKVLYSGLEDRDGGAIIASLQQMNIPYKMSDSGGAILVPSEVVYETRLRLASQGLPRGGNVGFELMDNQKLGISQFQEQVNYQRALEGELARSVQSLSSVQYARVHLAIPRPSVFIRDQEKPSASVLLNLYPGRVLDQGQVSGIVHMVSSSVPDLSYKNVTVVDQNGNLLSKSDSDMGHAGLDSAQLDYVKRIELSYIKRIESILSPITGPGNVHAQVTADLDFSQVEQTAETFKPNPTPTDAAVRSEQVTESNGGGSVPSGVPGALSNQPPGAASAPITAPTVPSGGGSSVMGNSHKESTINYEVDKTIKHVKQATGTIKRLSVAVVVNNKQVTDKNGKTSFKPFAADEMRQINNLVREAMGYSQARGDTLNIVNAVFNGGEVTAEVPLWKDPDTVALAKEIAKNLLILAAVLVFVFGVVRPLLKSMSAPPPAQVEGFDMEDRREHVSPILSGVAGYEETIEVIKTLARDEPQIVAGVVKDWVTQE